MPMPQSMMNRMGSPFSDYQRIQPLITNVVVQRHKNSTVVLPKIPKKDDKKSEGSGRSPLRTTSYCGIMEMIKEEEAQ